MDGPSEEKVGFAKRSVRFVSHDLWMIELGSVSGLNRWLTRTARVCVIATREFLRNRCMQHAMALTYLTIFSLPALLALVFSVAKGLNVFSKLKEGPIDGFLDHAFPEAVVVEGEAMEQVAEGAGVAAGGGGQGIRDMVEHIFTKVQEADLGVLSALGVLFLVFTALKMLGSVEAAFNHIWGVKRSRSLLRKFTDYLAIVAVAPLMLMVGTGFTGLLSSSKLRGFLGDENSFFFTWAIPVISICLGMTLVLSTLPNTRVRLRNALAGGLVAGISWQLAQLAFVNVQIGLMSANPILSSFAAVPLLLSWIYFSWLTLFVGCEVSYASQNVDLITTVARTGKVDQAYRESLAPRLAGRVAAHFLAGEEPPSVDDLAAETGLAPRLLGEVLDQLVEQRILAATGEEQEETFLPARDPATIRLSDVLSAMRRIPDCQAPPEHSELDQRSSQALAALQLEQSASQHNLSLEELASEGAASAS